jgi:peptidoglycan hydrolase-like protein with peptidoglycan-binding domain
MLIVNQGAQSPRAVALQILLNRFGVAGTPLKVDGFYGPDTTKAVANFREKVLNAPGPGTTADVPLWNEMLRRNRLQTIEAVDVTDPLLLTTTIPALEAQKASPITLGGTSNGVQQLMNLITAQAASMGGVMLLRFHAHGGPGVLAISHGNRSISVGINPEVELSILNQITTGKTREALSSIAGIFADFGFVEFHACRVADGPKGMELLQALCEAWKVPVTAPLAKQGAAENTFYFRGETRTVFPGSATLRDWAGSREEATKAFPVGGRGAMVQPGTNSAGGVCIAPQTP